LAVCCGAALVPSVICDAVTNLRRIGTYRAPYFLHEKTPKLVNTELTISIFKPTRRV